MSVTVALAGWLLAAGTAGAAALLGRELARRGELVARACHELGGPLTAARLGLHLVGRTSQAAGQRLVAIDGELCRAGLALEDLHAARVGRRVQERREDVDVGALLVQSVMAWHAFAVASGADLSLDGPPCRAVVRGDRLRLAQACGNLVCNAIEHGGGRVAVGARADGQRVRIEVRDSGPGLPAPVPELAAHARRGRGRRGRGLAIASEIARAHGGRLAAAPSARGATLTLELPRPRPGA